VKRLALLLAVTSSFATGAWAADAKTIYTTRCTVCHGADGKGTGPMGKKLGVKDLSATKLTAAEIEAMIAKGKGKMVGFEGKLSHEEIKAVAAFVKGGLK
jgi:cytochrome c6